LNNWTFIIVEAGLNGYLVKRLAAIHGPFVGGQVLPGKPEPDELLHLTDTYRIAQHADVGLGVTVHPSPDGRNILMVLITPQGTQQLNRLYGGPPEYASFWAFNQSLDLIRRIPHDNSY